MLLPIIFRHDNEQSDLLHRINLEKKNLQDLPRYNEYAHKSIIEEKVYLFPEKNPSEKRSQNRNQTAINWVLSYILVFS